MYGRKCLARAFKTGNNLERQSTHRCIYCRKVYRLSFARHLSPHPFWKESVKRLSENCVAKYHLVWCFMLILLLPYVCAVGVSMDIGTKVNVSSDHWLRTTSKWLRVLLCGIAHCSLALGFSAFWCLIWYLDPPAPFWIRAQIAS